MAVLCHRENPRIPFRAYDPLIQAACDRAGPATATFVPIQVGPLEE